MVFIELKRILIFFCFKLTTDRFFTQVLISKFKKKCFLILMQRLSMSCILFRHQNVFWFWFINWKPRIKIYWLTLLLQPRFFLVVKSSIFSVVNRPTDKCKIHDSYIFLTAPIDQSGRASIIPSSPDWPGPGSLRTQNYQTGPGVPAPGSTNASAQAPSLVKRRENSNFNI